MLTSDSLLLVTGATGLVGRHVVDEALDRNIPVRVLVRAQAEADAFAARGADVVIGGLTDPTALSEASKGVTHVVNCAAKVGDWGPIADYRAVNVDGLRSLLEALRRHAKLQRFVHISSLGVYPAKDHWGTDESEPISRDGIDGYTLSKVEAEAVICEAVKTNFLPGVILRPGFIYGPHDRSVLPKLLERLRSGHFAYLGDKTSLMNNTFVKNLRDAVFLVLERDDQVGEIFNITDGRLVTKEEFVGTVAELAGLKEPSRAVPLVVARALAATLETIWRWRGKTEAPLLSRARIKFLGLNLDFSIEKARHTLGYNPRYDFQDGMAETIAWFQKRANS